MTWDDRPVARILAHLKKWIQLHRTNINSMIQFTPYSTEQYNIISDVHCDLCRYMNL